VSHPWGCVNSSDSKVDKTERGKKLHFGFKLRKKNCITVDFVNALRLKIEVKCFDA
jgi:hypothetical protein